ncbi:7-deoxyloganetin glucosyltransferase [Arachis hypogaea]|nr:7-deoxyloganetin glucosyltransferase [Arachis hypogaea]
MERGDGGCGGGLSHASHDSHGSSVSMRRRRVNAHDGSCFCGLKTVIKKSGTAENPNRLFHACPRYRGSHCNYFKWVDDDEFEAVGLCSFRKLIASLVSPNHDDVPPVTCIVSDGAMWFTLKVAQEFHIPHFVFFTPSACGMLGYINFEEIRKRGYFPLKDEKNLLDGYLDTEVDWIPAMKGARLKDFPTFLRTTNPSDVMFNYNIVKVNTAMHAKGVILNTFEDLESEVLDAIRAKYSNVYSIGPLSMLFKQLSNSNTQLESIDLNLWKEDNKCLEWLDKRDRGSVVYVNYGSLVIMTPKQLSEFAWGLINNKYHFLWVIRPNLVHDNNNNGDRKLSDEYVNVIERCERGLVLGWCQQEKVLCHASIGGFLTHCGWNSTLESICEGVPMACWPFFAEQQTNSFYACKKWGIGMEIECRGGNGAATTSYTLALASLAVNVPRKRPFAISSTEKTEGRTYPSRFVFKQGISRCRPGTMTDRSATPSTNPNNADLLAANAALLAENQRMAELLEAIQDNDEQKANKKANTDQHEEHQSESNAKTGETNLITLFFLSSHFLFLRLL